MPPRHRNTGKTVTEIGNDSQADGKEEEYRLKRDRNNVAVRKSREKSRQKAKDTVQRVKRLKQENEDLEMKVHLLSKELSLLKDLFLNHATSGPDVNSGTRYPNTTDRNQHQNVNLKGETSNGCDGLSKSFCHPSNMTGAERLVNADAVQKDHEYSLLPNC